MSYYPDNVLDIQSPTPSETDAKQYIIRHSRKQTNLCGEFCTTYVTNNRNIDIFLDTLQIRNPKLYKSLFPGNVGRTTGIYDLEQILDTFEWQRPYIQFSKTPINPESVSDMLVSYRCILGVHIDHTGYLVGKNIPHWIVLEKVLVTTPNTAICDIYNPFMNRAESYSWRELMNSTGAYKQGIWVKR